MDLMSLIETSTTKAVTVVINIRGREQSGALIDKIEVENYFCACSVDEETKIFFQKKRKNRFLTISKKICSTCENKHENTEHLNQFRLGFTMVIK